MSSGPHRDPPAAAARGERIAKLLARAGVASRREVERMIAEGRVAIDGRVLTSPALCVADLSGVTVDGRAIGGAERTRLWLYHKAFGLVTTHVDPQGRATVFDSLPADMPRVISVGRLDQNTEGLLLLTNDGALSRFMELPATALPRRYRVRVRGAVDPAHLTTLARGLTLEGVHYGPIEMRVDVAASRGLARGETWLAVMIREGKNREVRKVMRHLGLSVLQLVRVAFGPFELADLPVGGLREVPAEDIARLRAVPSAPQGR